MKILVTCDPGLAVPPGLYGGVERMVSGVCREYAEQGHEVYLVASRPSSEDSVKEVFFWPADTSRGFFNIVRNALFLFRCCRKVRPDIVHSFSRLLYLYPLLILGKPDCVMSYGRFISKKSVTAGKLFGWRNLYVTCCGKHMLRDFKNRKRFFTIYNFMSPNLRYEAAGPRNYLAYLSGIERQKGVKEAIQAAKLAGVPLVIAGNIKEPEYFQQHVAPHLDGRNVRYIGPVNDEQKNELFQGASAFLFPTMCEEAFGIVMVEAMACGVPVVAFRRGAIPEVVKDGENGFAVTSVEEMAAAVPRTFGMDRAAIRTYALEHFSRKKIGTDYLQLFQRILGHEL